MIECLKNLSYIIYPNIIVDNNKGIKLGYRGENKTAYIGLDANDAANAGSQSWANSAYIGFYSDGSSERSIKYRTSAGSHIFQGVNGTEFARINSTGSVGIGSTTPDAKLSVVGVGTFKEDVYIDVTHENWFGVTYKEDSEIVKNKIKNLVEKNTYPYFLWD